MASLDSSGTPLQISHVTIGYLGHFIAQSLNSQSDYPLFPHCYTVFLKTRPITSSKVGYPRKTCFFRPYNLYKHWLTESPLDLSSTNWVLLLDKLLSLLAIDRKILSLLQKSQRLLLGSLRIEREMNLTA